MKKYLGMSLAIGITAGTWAFVAETFGLTAWPAFIGWSIFFFTGGDFNACKKSLPCILLGAVLGWAAASTQIALGTSGVTSALVIVVLAFTMTIAQSLPIFSVASATFIGCSHYFGTGSLFDAAVITSVGLVLGIISVYIGSFLNKKVLKIDIET